MATIYDTCFKCGGSGTWNNMTEEGNVPVDPCPVCSGTGKSKIYNIDVSDIIDKINDVLDKCNDIMEKLSE